ncbi:ectonucleoside triphosphate diphosphohydrolase 8-like isoform X2 [Accipiter gentilis]|uniref:ectonucleoside triphosphate diphosphohydrolase 8-like isoform X2 n=1 Tax=Astur gentilis TaxID=8957 RepID=UPI0021109797|nr:ectonucleoside triphosphate diphosphohydrolase 8-like isoform X2 [Accipiter gentilis]
MQTRLLRVVGWSLAAMLGVLGVAIFLLVLTLAKDAALPTRNKYGLVFDAGSTHTALYIYRWPTDKENGTGIVSQVEACTVSGPGISSYADNPAGAGASLKPCLDKAMKIIPAEQQRETPAYLGATAGMRLLREQNSTKAEQVLAEVAKAIGEYPVDFRGARILMGNEEGSFGWITVNYLLEMLIKCSFTGKWIHPPAEDVVGALDLGGASTQITFLPGTTIDDSSMRVVLRLYGTNYSIYTHSYLCYGQNQALKMLMASLYQGSPSPQQISHPCYPKGYRENITTADLYNSPCVRAPSTPSPAQVLTVTGTGDPAACTTAIQKLFNFSCGVNRTCGFNGVYQPPVRGQFFAFSGLYHNFHFLNLTGGQSLTLVNATIGQFCTSSWEKVRSCFGDASPCPRFTWVLGSLRAHPLPILCCADGSWRDLGGVRRSLDRERDGRAACSLPGPSCSPSAGIPRSLLPAALWGSSLQCGCTKHCSVLAALPSNSTSAGAEGVPHHGQDPPP